MVHGMQVVEYEGQVFVFTRCGWTGNGARQTSGRQYTCMNILRTPMKSEGRGGMVVNEFGVIHVVLTKGLESSDFVEREEELVGPRGFFEYICESYLISNIREFEYDHLAIQLMQNRWLHQRAKSDQPHYQKFVYGGM